MSNGGCVPLSLENAAAGYHTKKDNPAMEPFSYRLLCMLETVGKILERISHSRIDSALVEINGSSEI